MKASWFIVFFLCCISSAQAQSFFVSTTGNDNNVGSLQQPYKTIAKAVKQLQTISAPKDTVHIYIRNGAYTLSEGIAINPAVLGNINTPVTIEPYNNETVTIKGSLPLKKAAFKKITDPTILARIPAHLRDSIYVVALNELNIKHSKAYPDNFDGDGNLLELFMNNERMPLSRYPNRGYMTMKKVLINGGGQETKNADWADFYGEKNKVPALPPRPGVFEYRDVHENKWVGALPNGVWLKGYWRVPWQNEAVRVGTIDTVQHTIKLAVPVGGGIGNKYTRPEGNGKEKYWLLNLLDEIDQPGEWAVDFPNNQLYFYPPGPLKDNAVRIADIGEPLFQLTDVANISIKRLNISESISDAVVITEGKNCLVAGCTINNISKYAIRVNGGFNHTVQSCDLFDLGVGGVWLAGGDEKATPRVLAHHSIINNHIYRYGLIQKVYGAGINCGFTGGGGGGHHNCVGMYIAHNMIHDAPHVGVLYGSYDNRFEKNEVFNYCLVSDDMGAFYCYDKYERMGYDTISNNFIHNSYMGDAVYFDNDHPNMQVFGNIIALNNDAKKRGTAYLFKIGSQVESIWPN